MTAAAIVLESAAGGLHNGGMRNVKRSSLVIALVIGMMAGTMTAPPDLMVSERGMERHLEELGITGEAANDVRGAWGRMAFNLREGEAAQLAVKTWCTNSNLSLIAMNFQEPVDQFRTAMMDWYQSSDLLVATAEIKLVQTYFDSLADNAPAVAERAEEFRLRHLRTTLIPQIRIERVAGAKWDVIAQFDAVVAKHNLEFDDETAAAIETIRETYEHTLVPLLLKRRHEMLKLRRAQETDPPLDEGNDEQLRARIDRNMRQYTMDRQIRRLNIDTAKHLLSLVPPQIRVVLEREFDEVLYTVPLDGLQFIQLTDAALRDGHLDASQADALKATLRDLQRQLTPLRNDLISRFDAIYTDASIQSMLHEQLSQFTGYFVPTKNLFRDRSNEYTSAWKELEAFDERAVQRLRALLGPTMDTLEEAAAARQAAAEAQREAEQAAYRDQHYRESAPGNYHPFLSASDLDALIGEFEGVSDDVAEAIRELHAQFTTTFGAEVAGHHERMKQAQVAIDYNVAHEKWAGIHTRLEREFEAAVRRLLTNESDVALWDREMRRLRRERVLVTIRAYIQPPQYPFVIELTGVLDDLGLSEEPSADLSNAIEQYEIASDAACRRFEDDYMDLLGAFAGLNAKRNAGDSSITLVDYERALARPQAILAAILELRFQFAPMIAAAIDDENDRAAFLDAIARREFNWAFTPSPVDLVALALERDGVLDAQQQLAMEQVVERYESLRRDYHRRMFEAFHLYVRAFTDEQVGRRTAQVRTIAPERFAIERNACEAIAAILSAEQLDAAALDIRVYLAVVME